MDNVSAHLNPINSRKKIAKVPHTRMQHHLLFLSAGLPAKRSSGRHELHFRHKMKSRKQPFSFNLNGAT